VGDDGMSHNIAIARSIQEITDCFSVMKELRSHLEIADFIAQVQRQQQQFDYQLVYLQVDKLVRAVVFDLFDIKFVQAEERIEFEWRGESG
jgi:hypothetical protein